MPTAPAAPAVCPRTESSASATAAARAVGMASIPSAPASATATARAGVAVPPIPACWSGTVQPTRRVKADSIGPSSVTAGCRLAGISEPS